MKAIKISDHYLFELSDVVYDKKGNEYKWEDICLVPGENEEVLTRLSSDKEMQIRTQASIAFMHAVMSDHEAMKRIADTFALSGDKVINNILAKKSVEAADALIQELKRIKI